MKNAFSLCLLLLTILSVEAQETISPQTAYDCIEKQVTQMDSLDKIGEYDLSFKILTGALPNCIIGMDLQEFVFTTLDESEVVMKDLDKPTILKMTASWCAPCRAEVPALNQVAEEFGDQINVVVLFWDLPEGVEEMKAEFGPGIQLIPSQERREDIDGDLIISDFQHSIGFPASYYLNADQVVANFSVGASMPMEATEEEEEITVEEANEWNYNNIKKKVLALLEKPSQR